MGEDRGPDDDVHGPQRVGKVRKMGKLVSQSSCRLPKLSSVLSWCRSSLHILNVRVLSETVLRHAFSLFSLNNHSFIHSFNYSFIQGYTSATVHVWRSKDNLDEAGLSFCHVGSGDWTQVANFVSKYLYMLGHLVGLFSLSWWHPLVKKRSEFWINLICPFCSIISDFVALFRPFHILNL